LKRDEFMKVTEKRLKEIIKEELERVNEEDLDSAALEPKAMELVSKLEDEEQAIVLQYITLLKGNK